jgi:hypothetical protein
VSDVFGGNVWGDVPSDEETQFNNAVDTLNKLTVARELTLLTVDTVKAAQLAAAEAGLGLASLNVDIDAVTAVAQLVLIYETFLRQLDEWSTQGL